MGKRKGRKEAEEAQIPAEDELGENGEEGKGFFACYLLTSLSPRFKGHTYIGYTLNPRRRIRQHNGEIGSGAWRTKSKRPWEMLLCIYGFPTNIAALQFEWAWQHPVESLAVRKAAASFKSLSGLANKIKLAYTMLTLPPWQSLNLTVNLFSTKYRQYTSACPALPKQMRTQVCSMEELPCYSGNNACINDELDDFERECSSQESRDESTGAVREAVPYSSSFNSSLSEENFNHQINHTDGASLESSGTLARTQVGLETNASPSREEDQGRLCINNNSPARTSFLSQSPGLVDLTTGSHEPLNKQVKTAKYQVLIKKPDMSSREVEIIDIFTPSPCYLEKSGSKKRRPNLWPEVIDLTNSPMFV
ncbi:hypothetical protein C2S51_023224 [Perilla frutescens var. frutescens]|nr:hypothetical protein C2S51_023224 [Perilla frutescens var. frutescens]